MPIPLPLAPLHLLKKFDLWWTVKRLKGLPTGASPKRPNCDKEIDAEVVTRLVSHGGAALPALLSVIEGDDCAYVKNVALRAVEQIGDPQAVPVLTDFLTSGAKYTHGVHRTARWALESIGNLNDPITLQGLHAFERTLERTHDAWLVYVDKTTFRRRLYHDMRRYMECQCEGIVLSSLSPEIVGAFVPIKAWLMPLEPTNDDTEAIAVSVDANPIRDFDLSRFGANLPVTVYEVDNFGVGWGLEWKSPSDEEYAQNALRFFVDPLTASKIKPPFIISGRLLAHVPHFAVRVQLSIHTWDETVDFAALKRFQPDVTFPEKLDAIGEGAQLPVQVEDNGETVSGLLRIDTAHGDSVFDGELFLCSVSPNAVRVTEGTRLTRLRHEDKDEPNPLPFDPSHDIQKTLGVVLSARTAAND